MNSEPDGSGKRKRRWIWPTATAAALLLGVGIGAAAGTDQSKVDEANRETAQAKAALHRVEIQRDQYRERLNSREQKRKTAEATAARLKAEQDAANRKLVEDALAEQKRQADAAAAQQAAAAAAEAARNGIDGDGVYAIGTDKNPGRYKTSGAPTGCYWQISPDPNMSDIIENNFGDGVAYVQLSAGQYFKTADCGSWTKVG